jgi:hypothetical protein
MCVDINRLHTFAIHYPISAHADAVSKNYYSHIRKCYFSEKIRRSTEIILLNIFKKKKNQLYDETNGAYRKKQQLELQALKWPFLKIFFFLKKNHFCGPHTKCLFCIYLICSININIMLRQRIHLTNYSRDYVSV